MSKKAKFMVAAAIAAVTFGGLAPVVSADEERGLARDYNRITQRDVGRVSDGAADLVEETGEDLARAVRQIVNPR